MLSVFSPPARATQFSLGDADNFAVLYEGAGGNTLNYNNSTLTGNIGIGGTGQFTITSGTINGNVEFSAGNTGQFSQTGGTINGSVSYTPNYNVSNIQTDLNYLNSLSQSLGGETGAALTITSGGSVNASSGALDSNGNRVFTLQSNSNFSNGTFTITGTSSQTVVINVPMSFSFNGSIVLSGGITSDQVLFNFTAGNYSTLSGGNTLTISTNGLTTTGTFLDPNGNIQINHSVLDGSLFGGDTHDMSIVSGNTITAPPPIP